jgi:hypothetical protein
MSRVRSVSRFGLASTLARTLSPHPSPDELDEPVGAADGRLRGGALWSRPAP